MMPRGKIHNYKHHNSDSQILKYLNPQEVLVNLPFILTPDKILHIGMPYLKIENWLADSRTEAVRLMDVWDDEGILYVKVQNLTTLKVNMLFWNIQVTNGSWMWCLASLEFIDRC